MGISNPARTNASQPVYGTRKQVFIHIPKTAGSYIRSILEKRYGRLGCAYPSPPFKRLCAMDQVELDQFLSRRALIGHEDYCSFYRLVGSQASYTTILRNPVDRVISLYNHAQTHFANFQDHKVSLLKYLSRNTGGEVNNLQVRYLCGKPKDAPVTTDDAAHAIELVRSGRIQVGIQECLPQSFAKLDMFRDINLQDYPQRINASSFGFSRLSFTLNEIDKVRQMNALDFQLYAYCLERLKQM